MPRPPLKRRRSNKQSSNTSKHASAQSGLQPNPRVKLQQRLANKAIGQRPHDSDDSDRLVTRRRSGRNVRDAEPIFASGGVAQGDKPGVLPTKEERQRRLRSDTEEIIRRSRSKSIEARKGKLAKSRSNSVISSNVDGASSPIPNAQISNDEPPRSALPKSQPTPMSERSLLGTLKPRRRQPSILHLVDNNDSSAINSEDEEQFLPDDESTPLNSRNETISKQVNQLSTDTLNSASRKRKLGADEPIQTPSGTSSVSSGPRPGSSASNHVTIPASSRQQLTPAIDDDDDIMAPPQSSSPESSPRKSQPITSNKATKPVRAPTTEQLQSMMPSKRRKGTRDRILRSEFDIPEDSESNEANAEDESIYNPRKRATTKPRNKKDISAANPTSKAKALPKLQTQKITAASAAIPVSKSKQSSKSTSTPLTVTSPRTPLPLTRNTNQENKTIPRQARNRGSKPNGDNKNAPSKTDTQTGYEKSSGGSRPQHDLRGGIDTGAGSDKENSGYTRTRSLRKRTLPIKSVDAMDVDDPQPSIEPAATAAEEEENGLEIPESTVSPENGDVEVTRSPTEKIASLDAKAWKDKWGDIDNWDLAFEEVDVSTGSSSPLLKASVV